MLTDMSTLISNLMTELNLPRLCAIDLLSVMDELEDRKRYINRVLTFTVPVLYVLYVLASTIVSYRTCTICIYAMSYCTYTICVV